MNSMNPYTIPKSPVPLWEILLLSGNDLYYHMGFAHTNLKYSNQIQIKIKFMNVFIYLICVEILVEAWSRLGVLNLLV